MKRLVIEIARAARQQEHKVWRVDFNNSPEGMTLSFWFRGVS